jgi:thiamine-monophosphate kinase
MESEFDLIAALVERLPPPGDSVRIGSGDDAAVIEPNPGAQATSVDAIVDGVHFRLNEFGPAAVGRKALAAALSDLAAMGADPGEAYVALGIPEGTGDDVLMGLADGLAEVSKREGVSVVGGDVTRAPALSLAVTCVGYEPQGGRLVTRGGAQPGDVVAITGELGGAAGGLLLLERDSRDSKGLEDLAEALKARQLDPRPRFEAGRAFAAAGATSMIDISDGIGGDAGHLASQSGVRIEIEAQRLPLATGLVKLMGGSEQALPLVLSGGEDYELLATLAPGALDQVAGELGEDPGITQIGRVLKGEGAVVLGFDGSELDATGFDHMRGSAAGSS